MGQDSVRIFTIARKLGTMTAAAAAFLASSTVNAKLHEPVPGHLSGMSVLTASEVEERSKRLPPPLVLKPSSMSLQLAGHRSHSSHSSHRSHSSHASGSGHSSHYSSAVGTRSTPSMAVDTPDTTQKKTKFNTPEHFVPVKSALDNNKIVPSKEAAPEDRFQLINLPNVKEEVRAYIKDRTTGKSVLLSIGDEIDGYVLVEIDSLANTVRLRLDGKNDVTLHKVGLKK